MKKTVVLCAAALLASVPIFSQEQALPADTVFSDISLVKFAGTTAKDKTAFIIGENSQSFTAERSVEQFCMNRYETTYRLWYRIRMQAQDMGYIFQNPGQEGSAGRRGRAPTDMNCFQPVTMINWYDAIVWCNALSETEGRTPCYTYNGKILRDSSDTASCDLAVCDWNADGYRLPTETEWEYAARKTKSGYQRGDLVSGQVDKNGKSDSDIDERFFAWFDGDTDMTRAVGTAGTVFTPDAPPAPGTGTPNASGIYDMSGNVLEYCWDWFADYTVQENGIRAAGPEIGSQRVSRGGSWSPYTAFICAGDRYSYDANEMYNYMGFRFCTK